MNNTFNFGRFVSYFKKHTLEHCKTYLLSTVVLVGILIIALLFVVAMSNGHLSVDWQMTVLMSTVLIGGSIFTSLTFSELGDKKKSIPLLTLPVSALEKYLVNWIYTYPIFLIVTMGSFYLIDSLAVQVSGPSINNNPAQLLDLTSKETPGILLLTIYTLFHTLTFWGAIYFEKMHFIKTAFVFFICLLGLSLFNRTLLSLITDGHVVQSAIFQGSHVKAGVQSYYLPDNPIAKEGTFVFIAAMLLVWVSAYFRLKEKQV
jgi:hypothetical protein